MHAADYPAFALPRAAARPETVVLEQNVAVSPRAWQLYSAGTAAGIAAGIAADTAGSERPYSAAPYKSAALHPRPVLQGWFGVASYTSGLEV